ncbi:MAG: flagellar biosynthesis anti-sigma factor FlgM [Gammaproteobacteria bacterium]|nr:flagellar biosynthesis anti-sigma factor FlgM [Gammaproteobacteria bacterium]
MNDIKIDKVNTPESPRVRLDAPKVNVATKTDGIVISQHLDKMVAFLAETNEAAPKEAERVKAMKNRIETNNYRVDVDALSDKLVHHLFNGI